MPGSSARPPPAPAPCWSRRHRDNFRDIAGAVCRHDGRKDMNGFPTKMNSPLGFGGREAVADWCVLAWTDAADKPESAAFAMGKGAFRHDRQDQAGLPVPMAEKNEWRCPACALRSKRDEGRGQGRRWPRAGTCVPVRKGGYEKGGMKRGCIGRGRNALPLKTYLLVCTYGWSGIFERRCGRDEHE